MTNRSSRRVLGLVASALVGVTFIGLAAASTLADSVTMQVRSAVVRMGEDHVDVFGSISSGAEGEYIAITGKECGIPGSSFRAVGGTTTRSEERRVRTEGRE